MSENAKQFNDEELPAARDALEERLASLDPSKPLLIAGQTASGKSALALRIAQQQGGQIINADALQVFGEWRILTARPSAQDEAQVPHALYGHVPRGVPYSVGDWLRAVAPLLEDGPRPIVVGGTGLYFTALTSGLADIPPTPKDIRVEADRRLAADGAPALLSALDPDTLAQIDVQNPMRVQRAWEVQAATGRGLADWHRETGQPLLPIDKAEALVLDADKDWIDTRISKRFNMMIEAGLIEEARANRAGWSPDLPSAKAIGASELMDYLDGAMTETELAERISGLTRKYAKRQRTWFRSRMKGWTWVPRH